jgi:hypothetical protein
MGRPTFAGNVVKDARHQEDGMQDARAINSATRRSGIGQVEPPHTGTWDSGCSAAWVTLPVPALVDTGDRVLLGVSGGYVGKIGAASREVAWETGTSA